MIPVTLGACDEQVGAGGNLLGVRKPASQRVQTRADGVLSGRDAILRIRQARPIGVHTSGYQIGLLPCTYQSRLGSADVRRPPFGANDPAAPAW